MWQTNYYNFRTFFLIIPRLVNVAESEFESEFSTLVTNYVLLRLSRLVIIFFNKISNEPTRWCPLCQRLGHSESLEHRSLFPVVWLGAPDAASWWGVASKETDLKHKASFKRDDQLRKRRSAPKEKKLRERRPTPKETSSEWDCGLLAQSLKHWPLDVVWRLS